VSSKQRERIERGRKAEERACRHLEGRGYHIVGRNVRSGRGEIDIIARRDDTLAVVEVRSKRVGSPLLSSEIVGVRKRKNVVRAAREVIAAYRLPGESVRFDVILVTVDGSGLIVGLDHKENAFSVSGEIV
jgi:putative endonuclease